MVEGQLENLLVEYFQETTKAKPLVMHERTMAEAVRAYVEKSHDDAFADIIASVDFFLHFSDRVSFFFRVDARPAASVSGFKRLRVRRCSPAGRTWIANPSARSSPRSAAAATSTRSSSSTRSAALCPSCS